MTGTDSSAAPISPLAIPPHARTLVLFGGSFDPPHLAHTSLPALVSAALGPDAAVVYIPAARSPHKDAPGTPAHHRLAMLRLALHGGPGLIWTDELDRTPPGGASYTVDTVRRARHVLDAAGQAHVGLRLLFGADQALAFHRWKQPHDILQLAQPLVLLRAPDTDAQHLLESLARSGEWSTREMDLWRRGTHTAAGLAQLPHASTDVRAAAAAGADLTGMVCPAVAKYIAEHGLYRASAKNADSH